MRRYAAAARRAAPPPRPWCSSARRKRPATRAQWWNTRSGTASSASPARCRRGSPSPLQDRPRRRASPLPRHDQILPFVHAHHLIRVNHRRAIELVENGRALERQPDIELFALINRTLHILAVEAHAPGLPQRISERRPRRLELRHFDRRHPADAAHAIRDDLHRLLRRTMAEHVLVL